MPKSLIALTPLLSHMPFFGVGTNLNVPNICRNQLFTMIVMYLVIYSLPSFSLVLLRYFSCPYWKSHNDFTYRASYYGFYTRFIHLYPSQIFINFSLIFAGTVLFSHFIGYWNRYSSRLRSSSLCYKSNCPCPDSKKMFNRGFVKY